MAKKIEVLIGEIASNLARQMDFEFIDCEYIKKGQEYTLTIFIDKKNGVNLDDCEKFSREIEVILDEMDPIDNEYILSVSSPGLDRALKTEKDFERNIDKKIYIKLYRAIDKRKEFIAKLLSYDDDTITIDVGKKEVVLEKKDIAIMKQHIEF